MSSRKMEFFVGMMVLGVFAGVFVMALLFGSKGGLYIGSKGGKQMTITFEKGGGINRNSLVLKNGIEIGRVYSVDLDENDKNVIVAFELEPERKIFSNEQPKINRTLLGDASIEFVRNVNYKGDVYELDNGSNIIGQTTGDLVNTMNNLEGDVSEALRSIKDASAGISDFMARVNNFLGDQQAIEDKSARLREIFTQVNDAFKSIQTLSDNLNVVAGNKDLQEKVREVVEKIPNVVDRVEGIADKAENFIDVATTAGSDVSKTLDRAKLTFDLVDKNLDNANVFTTSLAENGPDMMVALNESAADVRSTIGKIRGTVQNIARLADTLREKMDDPNSALGMLTDEEVGMDLRHIIKNAEELSQKLYPILDDARVFTNKIAHKPSSLLWDKNTYKGSTLTEKYGWQNESPTGGISSAIYRQTPAGTRIRSRSYYEPSADVNFMDDETRVAYENELAKRQAVQSLEAVYSEGTNGYQLVVPEGGYSSESKGGLCGAKRHCRLYERFKPSYSKWSFGSFCERLKSKCSRSINKTNEPNDVYAVNGNNMIGQGWENAQFVNYEAAQGVPYSVGQPIYYGNYDGGAGVSLDATGFYGNVDNSGCNVAPCEPNCAPTCEPSCEPNCETPDCQTPNCMNDCAPNCAYGNTNGNGGLMRSNAGYKGVQRVGSYSEEAPRTLPSPSAQGEQIEELPSSINRVVTPSKSDANSNANGAFEDDGLPVQFAPPIH